MSKLEILQKVSARSCHDRFRKDTNSSDWRSLKARRTYPQGRRPHRLFRDYTPLAVRPLHLTSLLKRQHHKSDFTSRYAFGLGLRGNKEAHKFMQFEVSREGCAIFRAPARKYQFAALKQDDLTNLTRNLPLVLLSRGPPPKHRGVSGRLKGLHGRGSLLIPVWPFLLVSRPADPDKRSRPEHSPCHFAERLESKMSCCILLVNNKYNKASKYYVSVIKKGSFHTAYSFLGRLFWSP